jgi:mRNA interferase MazF
MHRGEIRWYIFSAPDKRRPVVLITREPMIRRLNEVTVIAITTTIRNLDCEVRLSQDDGMPAECVINCDQIQTLPRHKIGDLVTQLSDAKINEIQNALLYATGFKTYKNA